MNYPFLWIEKNIKHKYILHKFRTNLCLYHVYLVDNLASSSTPSMVGGGLDAFLTLDVKELRKRWAKLYINFMVLLSDDPEVKALLEPMKESLDETNEKIMAFFKRLEELNEVEGP